MTGPAPFAAASAYRPLPRNDTLIRGARVLDGAGGLFERVDLLMRDGRIEAIGPDLKPPVGAAIIPAEGVWLTPGLIDPHSHLGVFPRPLAESALAWSDVNEAVTPNAAHVRAEHSVSAQDPAFARALAGGVTALCVLPGSLPIISGLTATLKPIPATRVEAMLFPGAPNALKMACGENPKRHFAEKSAQPTSRMGMIAWLEETLTQARAYSERAERRAFDPRLEVLVAALAGAVGVRIHAYRADDMAAMVALGRAFGLRIIAFEHAVEGYKDPSLFVEDGIAAVVWSDWWGFKEEAYDGVRENAAFLDAAGATVALHSDIAVTGFRLGVEAGKAMAAGRRAGLAIGPARAIRWITLNPARVLGVDAVTGSLAPGKNADVVIWRGDPFSIYGAPEKVFIDGALAYDAADPARRPASDFALGQPAIEAPR